MRRTIDVHNHLFPLEWIEYLGTRKTTPRMERRGTTMLFSGHGSQCSRINNPGHYDVEKRLDEMDKCGIDAQILSLTVPSVEELPIDEGVKWSRKINDYYAEVCRSHPGRFYAYAVLPLQDMDEALKELERAYRDLGVKGIGMYSNVNFEPISSPRLYPLYEMAEAYSLPIFIHPAVPFTYDIMKKHRLPPPLYGFTIDTTIAVASLIWTGVLEKHPGLNIVHAHLGGMFPYMIRRMEDVWRMNSREYGLELKMSASEYYRRQVYPDSISGHLPSMRCCLDLMGPSHMCLGTDYAHGIGNWEEAVSFVEQLGLSEQETDLILGGNAARIFHLDQ